MEKYIGQYWGDREIKEVAFSDEKTRAGEDRVVLTFNDGDKFVIPFEALDATTEKPIDGNEFRIKRLAPVLEKILLVLLESELIKDDMEHLINIQLPASINRSLDLAHKKLWGKESYEITLFDIDKIICETKD